ncbi:MAG: HlyC/CorC family transporter [Candidatus Marinimicrobia bacterium]|nr:HlyC/CorC family transporter [Candidatus Neomarinimicrobiota bacterium]
MNLLFLYFFLALGVSFLCSLLESIILSVTHAHAAVMAKTGMMGGKIIQNLKKDINRPLAAILTLNTIANVVGAAGVGAQTLVLFGNKWVALSSGILTLSILIFSEIIPKTIGAIYWKSMASVAAYSIRGLIFISFPFVYFSEQFSKLIQKRSVPQKVSREEVIAMAEVGEHEGTILEKESDIIDNLLTLNEVPAEDVSTPRNVVFALQKDQTVGEIIQEHSPIAFSRIPVYNKDLDDVIGVIHRYDLVNKQAEDQFDVTMEELHEPVYFVQQEDSVAFILDEFVKRRQQMFIVTDEFGTTTGIITLEDAIETLLGVEIVDEHDSVVDMRKLASEKYNRERKKNQY